MNDSIRSLFLAALVGLCLSVCVERLMSPRPSLGRPWLAWMLHGGLWLLTYAMLVLCLGRPWFSTIGVTGFLLVLVLVNNAKVRTLQEPFVFQDYEYFTDAIRHPRLYIPFLGWTNFIFAVLAFILAVSILIWDESIPDDRLDLAGQLGGVLAIFLLSFLLIFSGNRAKLLVRLQPWQDIVYLGFIASLWRYAQIARQLPIGHSPFDTLVASNSAGETPHLVAIQSESFFDPRDLYSGIRTDVLDEFDVLKQEALMYGKLHVPAWGANTVRTEFTFLSGIDLLELGVHQFNPYRALVAGWNISSIAHFLKKRGYRTVCIHPYPADFYQRNVVYPRLGFDEFIDIQSFTKAERSGPYISDAAVTKMVLDVLNKSESPVFIFAITMENHGPLRMEKIESEDISLGYKILPPKGFDDMTIYLRHLRNANQMVGNLRRELKLCERLVGLCWYGDHVPIMPDVYQHCGMPTGEVDFVLWFNKQMNENENVKEDLDSHELSMCWLGLMGLAELG